MSIYAESLSPAHKSFLSDLFPGEASVLSREGLMAFSADASQERAMPWAVVRPGNRGQIEELLKWANVEGVPIYVRARGTGRVGNAVPTHGGVVVSMLGMDRILEVDENDFVAVVQPGVVTGDLQAACVGKRLMFPPDPASVKYSTIGGNVRGTRHFIASIKAPTPGRIIPSAARISSGFPEIAGLAPACSSPF